MDVSLYMIIEKYKDSAAVYRRFCDKGRMAPEGLNYISSWVDTKLERCYQVMKTNDYSLLEKWMANWKDIVEFEVIPVISSKEASGRIAPQL